MDGIGQATDEPPTDRGDLAALGEWAVALAGVVIVLAMLGYIGWYALTHDSTVPALSVEATGVVPRPGGYLVTFRATNSASGTAASAQIIGELLQGDTVVETSEAVLDYVPSHSSGDGGLFFTRDPAAYRLALRPGGYVAP